MCSADLYFQQSVYCKSHDVCDVLDLQANISKMVFFFLCCMKLRVLLYICPRAQRFRSSQTGGCEVTAELLDGLIEIRTGFLLHFVQSFTKFKHQLVPSCFHHCCRRSFVSLRRDCSASDGFDHFSHESAHEGLSSSSAMKVHKSPCRKWRYKSIPLAFML